MRWMAFAAVAVTCVTLQTTVAPHMAVGGVRPDWIVVIAVFFAMHARTLDVVIAGWFIGLLADFQTAERFGVLSIAYALAALVAYATRENVFRTHPLSHFAITFASAIVVQASLLLYYLLCGGFGGGSVSGHLVTAGLIAVYSAVWAPPLHALLLKMSPLVGTLVTSV